MIEIHKYIRNFDGKGDYHARFIAEHLTNVETTIRETHASTDGKVGRLVQHEAKYLKTTNQGSQYEIVSTWELTEPAVFREYDGPGAIDGTALKDYLEREIPLVRKQIGMSTEQAMKLICEGTVSGYTIILDRLKDGSFL